MENRSFSASRTSTTSLADFVASDAQRFVTAFLNTALERAYLSGDAGDARVRLQRSLVLRLLARNDRLTELFAHHRVRDFSAGAPPPAGNPSLRVQRLALRAAALTREETRLLAQLQLSRPGAALLEAGLHGALQHAICLERALAGTVELSEVEADTVFGSWSDAFAAVLRESYRQGAQMLARQAFERSQPHFEDTWPLDSAARARLHRQPAVSHAASPRPQVVHESHRM